MGRSASNSHLRGPIGWSGVAIYRDIPLSLVPTLGRGIPVHGLAINDALAVLFRRRGTPFVGGARTITRSIFTSFLLGIVLLAVGFDQGFIFGLGTILDRTLAIAVPTDGLSLAATRIGLGTTSCESRGTSSCLDARPVVGTAQ